jgi:hypothetical protein
MCVREYARLPTYPLVKKRRPLHLPIWQALVIGCVAVLLLLATDLVFNELAELVSGVLIVLGFVIAMRIAAVKGGRHLETSKSKR